MPCWDRASGNKERKIHQTLLNPEFCIQATSGKKIFATKSPLFDAPLKKVFFLLGNPLHYFVRQRRYLKGILVRHLLNVMSQSLRLCIQLI